MEDIREKKDEIRNEVAALSNSLSDEIRKAKTHKIETRLFEFANFLESRIALLYVNRAGEVVTQNILQRAFDYHKIIVLPMFGDGKKDIKLFKIDDLGKDLRSDANGFRKPDPDRCKMVPLECIDIAIIPGVAFDEKGGRVGSGGGFYDRLIPKLPITTRKVALAYEYQVVPQVPMESNDRHVDIIITETRVVYKI